MIMRINRMFVNTDILLYLADTFSPWQNVASKALQKARERGFELLVNQQVLREYLARNKPAATPDAEAPSEKMIESIKTFQASLTVLKETEEVLETLIDLLKTIPLAGKQIYSANIVATMLAYRIEHLLTHDITPFKPFAQRVHLLPLEQWVV